MNILFISVTLDVSNCGIVCSEEQYLNILPISVTLNVFIIGIDFRNLQALNISHILVIPIVMKEGQYTKLALSLYNLILLLFTSL